jgi:hypothetical protein
MCTRRFQVDRPSRHIDPLFMVQRSIEGGIGRCGPVY